MVADGEYLVWGANGIIGRYIKFNHEEPQLLITCRGATCWSVNVSTPKSWITGNAMVIKPKNNFINIKYLEYIFRGWLDITRVITGAAQPQITRTNLSPLEISYPESLPEQLRIVSILDSAFAGLDQARKNAETNLGNVREVFESYLQSVFASPGEDWEEKRFDEICVLQRWFDLPTHSRKEGRFPLVSSNGITDRIDLWRVKAPGVITGRSWTIGNVHFVEEDFWPLNTTLYIKEFHGNYEKFIYFFLKQFNLSRFSSGAGVPTLNRNNVHSEKVWFPKSLPEQLRIVSHLDTLSTQTKHLESIYTQKIAHLDELRKSLLKKVFAGKL